MGVLELIFTEVGWARQSGFECERILVEHNFLSQLEWEIKNNAHVETGGVDEFFILNVPGEGEISVCPIGPIIPSQTRGIIGSYPIELGALHCRRCDSPPFETQNGEIYCPACAK